MNRVALAVLAMVLSGCAVGDQGSASTAGSAAASPSLGTPAGSASPDSGVAAPDFAHPTPCSDTSIGYTLNYPGNWSTNTATPETPACRAFSTVGPFEVPSEIPEYVRIWILLQDTEPPSDPPGLLSRETVSVGGKSAVRQEVALDDAGGAQLTFIIPLGEPDIFLIAATSTDHLGDYDTNKDVLDWLMAAATFE